MTSDLHDRLGRALRSVRRRDGGFATSPTGESEVEPTVVAALALPDDVDARRWLRERQRADGSFQELDGRAAGPTTGALAALVLPRRSALGALAFAKTGRGLPLPNAADPEKRTAWGWTTDARSLVEPTARVLLAVNALTPADDAIRREGVAFMRERRCADGGWNFGNASVYDVDLSSYPQTTAIALIALQDAAGSLVGPALRYLRDNWRLEPGALTVSQTLLAFRFHAVSGATAPLLDALDSLARRTAFREHPLVVAWSVLATGPDTLLEPLRSRA